MLNFFRPATRIKYDSGISATADIAILYITYNRLNFTKITLPQLLDSSELPFSVTIVDNHSTDDTVEYLRTLQHPRIREIIFNRNNDGLVGPTKRFWRDNPVTFVGKIDNDVLVPTNWLENLVEAHLKMKALGILGYCHFRPEDYNAQRVADRMQHNLGIYFLPQPWIGGNYLAKRDVIIHNPGYHQSRRGVKKRRLFGFSDYQIQLAQRGYINGYLGRNEYELFYWEHLDDPRSNYYPKNGLIGSERGLTPEEIIAWYRKDAVQMLEGDHSKYYNNPA